MKKMRLVNPADTDRDIFEPPEVTKTVTLDERMKEILHRHDLNDEEKVKRYEDVLSRYTIYRTKAETPRAPPKDETQDQLRFVDDVKASSPKNLKGKAEQLARTVLTQLKWSPRGELIVNDRPISGSHVVDLVNDAIRYRKSFIPVARDTFVEELARLNVPRELIGNTQLLKDLNRFQRIGKVHIEDTNPVPASHSQKSRRVAEEDETPWEGPRIPLIEQRRKRDAEGVRRWLQYPERE